MTTDTAVEVQAVTRDQVEDFLYYEAALLDDWRMDDWLDLFTDDARYEVPSTDDRSANTATSLSLIDDDRLRLYWRVERLKSRHAHREYPYSRTRRLISNVRIVARGADGVRVTANFVVYRFRHGHADPFVGRYEYLLLPVGESFKIRFRRAELDHETLSPNGAVSMIL